MEPLNELGSPENLKRSLGKRDLTLASLSVVIGLGDKEKLLENMVFGITIAVIGI